ncbi:helix-turn-helix domain-containing protein [Nocardioides sp.]|uniref:helix-turn-helix domain-containing protein n=1 Tax=Nocardioides sp. TaxID=35761 RepID=UPI00321AC8FE
MGKDRTERTGVTAKALGVSPATVQSYARRGLIPCSQTPGGQYRFNTDEVMEVLGRHPIQEQEFASVFEGGSAVLVDELSAYRPDPVTEAVESRLRVRGADTRRSRCAEVTQEAGAAAFRELVDAARGSAVAVLHRTPEAV